jgi:hypothetical protein
MIRADTKIGFKALRSSHGGAVFTVVYMLDLPVKRRIYTLRVTSCIREILSCL